MDHGERLLLSDLRACIPDDKKSEVLSNFIDTLKFSVANAYARDPSYDRCLASYTRWINDELNDEGTLTEEDKKTFVTAFSQHIKHAKAIFETVIEENNALEELKKELIECNKELYQYTVNLQSKLESDPNFSTDCPTVLNVYKKYNGLCDLICNYFTIIKCSDLKSNKLITKKLRAFKEDISALAVESLAKTHILSLVSFVDLCKFITTGFIPHSIFTSNEKQRVFTPSGNGLKVEVNLLKDVFNRQPIGEYIKFSGFSKRFGVPVSGHSMLICKMDEDKYLFFSPDENKPSCYVFSLNELVKAIVFYAENYQDVSFVDNEKFLEKVDQNVFKEKSVLASGLNMNMQAPSLSLGQEKHRSEIVVPEEIRTAVTSKITHYINSLEGKKKNVLSCFDSLFTRGNITENKVALAKEFRDEVLAASNVAELKILISNFKEEHGALESNVCKGPNDKAMSGLDRSLNTMITLIDEYEEKQSLPQDFKPH